MLSKTFFSLFAAGFAAIANAQAVAQGPVPIGNPISHPGLLENVVLNEPFQITWKPTTPAEDTVTLYLCIGGSTNCVIQPSAITSGLRNEGTFMWTPTLAQFPKLIPSNGQGYGIQLVVERTGQYQYSTQFGMTFLDAPATITLSTASDAPTPTPVAPSSTPVETVISSASSEVHPTNSPFPTSWWKPTGTGAAPTTIIQPTGGFTSLTKPVSTPTNTPAPPVSTGAAGKVSAGFGAVAVVLAAFAL